MIQTKEVSKVSLQWTNNVKLDGFFNRSARQKQLQGNMGCIQAAKRSTKEKNTSRPLNKRSSTSKNLSMNEPSFLRIPYSNFTNYTQNNAFISVHLKSHHQRLPFLFFHTNQIMHNGIEFQIFLLFFSTK